jgi:hypothetical protein
LSGVAKNDKIRIGKAEVEVGPGEKTRHVSLTELEEEKNKGALGKKGNNGGA